MRLRTKVLLLTLGLGSSGCRDREADAPACRKDMDCDPGSLCVAGICLLGVSGQTVTFGVEVLPGAQSALLPNELPNTSFGDTPPLLRPDRKVTMETTLETDPNEPEYATEARSQAGVVLIVPAAIPGRPDLQFESTGVAREARAPFIAEVPIPERLITEQRRGTLRIFPRSPLDRILPPSELPLAEVRARLSPLRLPGALDMVLIKGRLINADDQPATDYLARAFRGGQVVSNTVTTAVDGRFTLRVPKLPSGRDPLEGLSVDLSAVDPGAARPRLTIKKVEPLALDLGMLKLPTFPKPQKFAAPVVSTVTEGVMEARIVGAKVRFATTLEGAVGGEATYVREVQTGADGTAQVDLIPGEPGRPRSYSVRVLPPERSEFAIRCVGSYVVSTGSGDEIRLGGSISLSRRTQISGRVFHADGSLAKGVRIRSTRLGGSIETECGAELAATPGETLSDGQGRYRVLVEPGDYRMEYEPPAGAQSPYFTEEKLEIQTNMSRDVRLPAAMVIEARVGDPETGKPVSDAVVRVFDPGTATSRALQRGQGISASDGRVRVVVPRRP